MKADRPFNAASAPSCWDRYWQADRLASCSGAGGRNYRPEVGSGWAAFFSPLCTNATILDLCTGNGAVALMAIEAADKAGKSYTVHAVDSAEINPQQFLTGAPAALGRIRFQGKVAAEQTPFADGRFDAICGQYAIEYTDVARTTAEIGRLLKPAGRLRFVVHATEGTVVASAHRQSADARFILEDVRFFNLARAVILSELEAEAASGGSFAQRCQRLAAARQAYDAAAAQLRGRAPRSADEPMFANVVEVIGHALEHRRAVGWEQVLRKIDEIEAEVSAYRARLDAMIGAARTEAQAYQLATMLAERCRQHIRLDPLQAGAALLGWVLSTP